MDRPSTRRLRVSFATALSALFLVGASLSASSSDWPRFRGPNGTGVADVVGLPDDLSPERAEWSREVPFGRSSPVVAGGRVFLTGRDGERLITTAFDAATGAQLWLRSVPRQRVDKVSGQSGPAVATPVIDGGGVTAFFPEFGLVSYDRDGAERWRMELPPFRSYYGLAASPVLEGGVLVLLCDQSTGPFILGVDVATGEELWKQEREVRAESWTTPVVFRPGTPEALVLVFGTFVADAYAPATGELVWRLPGLGATPVASPIVVGDMLYAVSPDQAAEFPPPPLDTFAALDADGDQRLTREEISPHPWGSTFDWFDIDGDGLAGLSEIETQLGIMASPDFGLVAVDLSFPGEPTITWRQKRTLPYIATPILYRDVLFLIKDGGILTSYDPTTGEVLKRSRIEGAVESFSPSPVAADGKLYLVSSVGTVAVVSAEREWATIAVSDLDEQVFASPAIAEGRLFVRTRSKLIAFRGDVPER